VILGVFAIRPGADSITLDRRGEWLYYAAVTGDHLYRIRTRDLNDETLSAADLEARVEIYYENKTHSDGITSDDADNIYITDPEHFAIHRIDAGRVMTTLFKDERLRWPDGFSFGPDGYLYFTCSSLQHVIWKGRAHVDAHAPYHIFRFRPGTKAAPGQ
jgi:sugar lactone lactonase YvrE